MRDLTLKDIDWLQFIDKEGKLKVSAIRIYLVQQSIYLRESIRNNTLPFQEFTENERLAICKFIGWYYD